MNAKLPGVDGFCFLTVPQIIRTKSVALKYLHSLIKKLKYDISLNKGYTNQAIQHKKINNLNSREKYRKYLKNKKRNIYIKNCKKLYRFINKNPVKYISNLKSETLKNNLKLKFKLLKSLKPSKIKNYSTDPKIQVYITKNNDKLKSLNICTLKDRTMQTLLKLAMEPYMEPLGDKNSFGFRPGRNYHQTISYLYNKLSIKTINNSKNKQEQILNNKNISNQKIQNLLTINKKQYYIPFHLLKTNINTCYNKINHNWLISNIPIPLKYKFLLKRVLKSNTIKNNKIILKKSKNKYGIPLYNMLSPLLINWALDGIENLICETVTILKKNKQKKSNSLLQL